MSITLLLVALLFGGPTVPFNFNLETDWMFVLLPAVIFVFAVSLFVVIRARWCSTSAPAWVS